MTELGHGPSSSGLISMPALSPGPQAVNHPARAIMLLVSELGHVARHALAGPRVGHGATGRLHVVNQMIDLARCWNRAGNNRVSDDKFQKKLCPARTAELLGPRRQRLAADAAKQLPGR